MSSIEGMDIPCVTVGYGRRQRNFRWSGGYSYPGPHMGYARSVVHGETSRIFIASDTLPLFKNLESDLFEISEIYVDLQIYRESMKRIANLAAFILPSSACRSDGTSMYMN
jgi:hypothetical protein